MTHNRYMANWSTVIELWQRYTDDGTSQTNLYGYANELMGIMNYPKLADNNNAVIDAGFAGGEPPMEMWTSGGGPEWLKWELNILWREEIQVTFAE